MTLILFCTAMFGLASCGLDSNEDTEFEGGVEFYDLQSTEASNVSGTAIFEELEDGSILVTLELTGTESGAEHPAHIHANTVVEGGGIDIPLNPVDGSTGRSETQVNSLSSGTPVTYNELINYDGHVNVHLSGDDLATVITRGNIGGNAFTGESKSYNLVEANESGVSGIVRFEERNNGNTLATIELTGTTDQGDHPAHIHDNSVAEGGGVAVPFNNVNGETGMSKTNIRADEAGPADFTYSTILDFNGHVNVHQSGDNFDVIAAGNIGSNEGEGGNGNGY